MFQPQPDPVAGAADALSSRLAAKLWARWELEGQMHTVSSSALIQCVSFTSTEQQWEMPVVQHGCPAVRRNYRIYPVSSGTKFWKGFDSEMPNHFQVQANVSLMLPHPRVKSLAWLSMAPH